MLYDTLPLPKEPILIHPIITSISTLRSTAYVKTCFPPDSFRVNNNNFANSLSVFEFCDLFDL